MRRRKRDPQRAELDRLPFIELVHDIETEAMHQTSDADWNDNWLIGCDTSQRSAIEMIEMRVGYEHEINRRQMMNMKARFFEPLDNAQPHRPDRIDQDVGFVRLNQKRSVPNPGDANLAGLYFGKQRAGARAGTFREQRWDPNAGDEIALGPIAARAEFYSRRFPRATRRSLANYLALS
jgi:hypothetical protein